MPAKLKKIPKLEAPASTESENLADDVPRNLSETVSTNSRNLLSGTGLTSPRPAAGSCDSVTVDDGPIDNEVIDKIDCVSTDTIDKMATSSIDMVTTDNGENDQSITVPMTAVAVSDNVMPETRPATSPEASRSVSSDEQTVDNTSTNASEDCSTEISRKLESPKTEDSNMDISEKADNTPAPSNPRIITDNATTVSECTNSENQIENEDNHDPVVSLCSEKVQLGITGTVNAESVIPRNITSPGNLGTSLKFPSTANSGKNLTATPVTESLENVADNSRQNIRTTLDNNKILGKFEYLIPLNAQKYFSETSGNYSPSISNLGKYMSEPAEAANTQKYADEIPRNVSTLAPNTGFQKPNPKIPGTMSASSNSQFLGHAQKSFEESVNSTFLKYFPEIPKSSFGAPLPVESRKYFRETPSTSVSSNSEKYIKEDPENQALVYPDEENVSEKTNVSSIDFLSSMVENIGKSSF